MSFIELLKNRADMLPNDSIQADIYVFTLQGKKYVLKLYKKYENHGGDILAGLSHDNIVKLYDHGYHRGHQYLIMDFVEGEPLSYITDDIEKQLRDLLAYLQSKGVEHHEFKPAHLILNAESRVKLIDFGIATSPEYELNTTLSSETNKKYGTIDVKAVEAIIAELRAQ